MNIRYCFLLAYIFLGAASILTNTVFAQEASTTPLVVRCTPSATEVVPDQSVTWTPEVISGDSHNASYQWTLEGDRYLRKTIFPGINRIGPFVDNFREPGIKTRYIKAHRDITSNIIGDFQCGSVKVTQFPLKTEGVKPDLIVDSIYFKYAPNGSSDSAGNNTIYGNICVDVKNIGEGGSAGSFYAAYTTKGTGESLFGEVPDPGKIVTKCFLNLVLVGNTNHVTVSIDGDKRINESNTENNFMAADIVVPAPPVAKLVLLSPHSGRFSQNSTMDIRWESSEMQDKVDLFYTDDAFKEGVFDGSSFRNFFIAEGVPNTGHYVWIVKTPSLNHKKPALGRVRIMGRRLADRYQIKSMSSDLIEFNYTEPYTQSPTGSSASPSREETSYVMPVPKNYPSATTSTVKAGQSTVPIQAGANVQNKSVPPVVKVESAPKSTVIKTSPLPQGVIKSEKPKATIPSGEEKKVTIKTSTITSATSSVQEVKKAGVIESVRNFFRKIFRFF